VNYDLIVVGSGASGLIASCVAASNGLKVLLLEKLPKIAQKLKASGGGKCNLTNQLSTDDFISHFGKDGRFMQDALKAFDSEDLIAYMRNIGVHTSCLDGFRVFPTTKSSQTIIDAFEKQLNNLNVTVICSCEVTNILTKNNNLVGVKTKNKTFHTKNIIISTGGLGYPKLGTTGDGYKFATSLGHKITTLYPGMMPLKTKETWVAGLTANTLPKVTMTINLPKAKKFKAIGDLIFTKDGIRGPVVLDFAREISPYFENRDEVPISINTLDNTTMSLTILKPDFTNAMITRGGVNLKEINPRTMESKIIKGLYFCGEVVNLDGPCGGYNLQWAFSSGYLAANSILDKELTFK